MVLLKNESGSLPLDKSGKKYKSIAVVGWVADWGPAQVGFWGGMITGGADVVTVIQGIKEKVGPAIKVEYAKGPSITREIPSNFDMYPGMKLHSQKPQSAADAQKAFDEAVATAKRNDLVVMVLGEDAFMAGEAASNATLRFAGPQLAPLRFHQAPQIVEQLRISLRHNLHQIGQRQRRRRACIQQLPKRLPGNFAL